MQRTRCTFFIRVAPADLGRGWANALLPSPSGIQPPADPKGPPLYYFEISLLAD